MPYSAKHKAETRARIVESARQMFNRHGFDAVSIDRIMASAGLTRGGFYNHFATKEELYSEAVASYARCNPAENWDGVDMDFGAPPRTVAMHMVNAYLSDQHLDNIDGHCPMIALPSDTARAGPAVREAYCMLLSSMVGVFEAALGADGDRRQKALAMATLCVGGMVLARTLDDEALRADVREAARKLALEVGGLNNVFEVG